MARAKARYEITAEDKTKRALDSARENVGALDRAMGSLARRALSLGGSLGGTVVTAGLGLMMDRAEQVASQMANLGDQVGSTAAEMQAMNFAAISSGLSVDEMARAVANLNRRAEEARTGNKNLAEAFAALGIDAKKFLKLGAEAQLVAFADGIAGLGTAGEQTRRSMQLLEEGGAKLLRIFRQGGDALAATLDQGRAFGAVADEDDLRRLQESGTALEQLKAQLDGVAISLSGSILRGYDELFDRASRFALSLAGVDPDAFRDVGRSANQAARQVDWLADRLLNAGSRMQGAFVIQGFVPPQQLQVEADAVETLLAQMDGLLARQEEAARRRERLLGRGSEVDRALTSFEGVNTMARERLEAANRGGPTSELRTQIAELRKAFDNKRTNELLEEIRDVIKFDGAALTFS